MFMNSELGLISLKDVYSIEHKIAPLAEKIFLKDEDINLNTSINLIINTQTCKNKILHYYDNRHNNQN